MRKHFFVIGFYFVAGLAVLKGQSSNPVVRFRTTLGDIDVELSPSDAPKNVANFLSYVDSGAYSGSFIHRSVPGFVIQGGGYTFPNGTVQTIAKQAAVVNEYKLPNARGTLAMALTNNDPNSATDQWFFNLVDNSTALGTQNVGYTVIGQITNNNGLAVMDAIAALQVINDGSPFDQLPVVNYYQWCERYGEQPCDRAVNQGVAAPGFFRW